MIWRPTARLRVIRPALSLVGSGKQLKRCLAQDHDVYKRRLDKDGKVIPDTVTKHEVCMHTELFACGYAMPFVKSGSSS